MNLDADLVANPQLVAVEPLVLAHELLEGHLVVGGNEIAVLPLLDDVGLGAGLVTASDLAVLEDLGGDGTGGLVGGSGEGHAEDWDCQ